MAHSLASLLSLTLHRQAAPSWHLTLLKDWPIIAGTLMPVMRLEKIYGNTLIIGVYDATWMHELYLLSDVLMQSINQHLANTYIHRIRFKQVVRTAPLRSPKVLNAVSPTAAPPLNSKQKAALAAIKDEELRSNLEKFFIRCLIGKPL